MEEKKNERESHHKTKLIKEIHNTDKPNQFKSIATRIAQFRSKG